MTSAVLKEQSNKDFFWLYLKDVPVVYASVQEPKFKYESKTEKEYALTAFVDDDTRNYLEETVLLNKEVRKVGVDKNKKKQIAYKLSSQSDKEDTTYDPYEGMNGLSLTLNEKKKDGSLNKLDVVDKDGNELTDLVGNGSICNIKCFGYRNKDDMLVVSLRLIQVLDLVPYEGGDGTYEDDELGITIKPKAAADKDKAAGFDVDDDVPFEVDDNSSPY